MKLMSISGAARHLGYKSRSQLYKLIDDGWLDDHLHINMPSGQRLLDVDGCGDVRQSDTADVVRKIADESSPHCSWL